MRGDASSEQEQDDPDVEFVEVDPTGRYGRVSILLYYMFIKFYTYENCTIVMNWN